MLEMKGVINQAKVASDIKTKDENLQAAKEAGDSFKKDPKKEAEYKTQFEANIPNMRKYNEYIKNAKILQRNATNDNK